MCYQPASILYCSIYLTWGIFADYIENHLLHAHAILNATHLFFTGCFTARQWYTDQPGTEGRDYLLHHLLRIVLASTFSPNPEASHIESSGQECQTLLLYNTLTTAT